MTVACPDFIRLASDTELEQWLAMVTGFLREPLSELTRWNCTTMRDAILHEQALRRLEQL